MSVGMQELKRSIKGGKITNAQRLKTTKDIEKKRESEKVLIEFEG